MAKQTLLVLLALSSSLVLARNTDGDVIPGASDGCHSPFQRVGSQCLLFDPAVEDSWNAAHEACLNLQQGVLVNLFDANDLHQIFLHIQKYNYNQSFWIGAYDLFNEGDWVWSLNNSAVRMHTPLWGVENGKQEPNGGTKQNCGMLYAGYYFYLFDEDCSQHHASICAATNEQKPFSKPVRQLKAEDCPSPYALIGNSCFMVDAIKKDTWEKQQATCKELGGHLASIDDANDFGDLYQYLIDNGISSDLWIGGSDSKHEGSWLWENHSKVPPGTPFWGEYDPGFQEPHGGTHENCLYLEYGDYYFFHDGSCNDKLGLVCEYDPQS